METLKTATVIGLAAVLALTLGACREDEQGRRLTYEPGVYKGKADTPVSEQARRALKTRIQLQNGLAGGSGGAGGARRSAPPNVRPPAGAVGGGRAAIPLDALRQRTRRQNFN